MRRKYFGLAIAAFATLGPMQAWAGDREIAEQIIERLKSNRDSGALKDFTLDMKVDKGVVLFRGNVSQNTQKDLVLQTAKGIEGINQVIDEVTVETTVAEAEIFTPKKSEASIAELIAEPNLIAEVSAEEPLEAAKKDFSFREAIAARAAAAEETVEPLPEPAPVPAPVPEPVQQPEVSVIAEQAPVAPALVKPTAAVEQTTDKQIVSRVVSALTVAKERGQLKGFGIDVKCENGALYLSGRASSAEQRAQILEIAENCEGVGDILEAIAIPSPAPALPRLPEPPALQDVQTTKLAPVAVSQVARPSRQGSGAVAGGPVQIPSTVAPYRMQGQTSARPASTGHVAGHPMPMAPYAAAGAGPRYDTPNLPNYAWPGYAAYPNYAALTYPQQYSPSAWPYIGPFYPYPQVPLGWRKISLEWDDGWWFLDFTDK